MSAIRQGKDGSLERATIERMKHLVREYELVKAKQHVRFKFLADFYNAHNLTRQNFIKYYNRYKQSGSDLAFLPRRRGPGYKARRTPGFIENYVIEARQSGANRYEIHSILKPKLKRFTPAPSTIYGILRRNNLNRLRSKMTQTKRTIIKQKAGELGHMDCHYLPKGIIENDSKRYYLIALVDAHTRVAWAEVIEDIKALTTMFAALRLFNLVKLRYDIQFAEVITDNGPEFGSGKNVNNALTHPFERMLVELGIKHRYTKPYRPQTNGKVERFWRTLKDDLLEGMLFDSLDHLKDELEQYVLYYNELREHQALNGKTPLHISQNCQRIT